MNIKAALFLIILAFSVFIGYIVFIEKISPTDQRCNWEPKECSQICVSNNYYFNQETSSCQQWETDNCCTYPPFETMFQCRRLCEK